jgi:hypothetical protein
VRVPLPVNVSVAVFAGTVRFVAVEQSHGIPVPLTVIWLAPRVIVRTLALDDVNDPHVQVLPFVFSVPDERLTAPETVQLSPSVIVPPGEPAPTVRLPSVLPFVMSVPVTAECQKRPGS